jgi:hypothetical protein
MNTCIHLETFSDNYLPGIEMQKEKRSRTKDETIKRSLYFHAKTYYLPIRNTHLQGRKRCLGEIMEENEDSLSAIPFICLCF